MNQIRIKHYLFALMCLVYSTSQAAQERAAIRYEVHHGVIADHFLSQIAAYDATEYYEYPYLFNPDEEYARAFLKGISTPSTILVVALDDHNKMIGALVSYSVEEEDGHRDMISKHSAYLPGKALYIAWVTVDAAYRNQHIAHRLIQECEAVARTQGYTDAYLITVMRAKNHPFKPINHLDLDVVWSKLGFNQICLYELWLWPTRCGVPGNEIIASVDNMVQYWHKTLVHVEHAPLSSMQG